jgi:RHS repeat-associated protein
LRQSMTVQGQSAVNYSYDSANRPTQITQGTATVGFSYDSANRRTSVTLPNGIQVGYNYDNASELTAVSYQNGGTVIGNLTYSYDAGGRRIGLGGSLAQVNLPAAIASATYDAANRLTSWAGTGLTYDDNGNLTGQGTGTFGWDARNQLTATSDGGGSYAYDAFGRRIGRTVGGVTNAYSYDGLNPVKVNSDFLLGGQSLDERYARINSGGTTSYLTDALGSTLTLINASAATTASYSYEPNGKTTKTGSDDTPMQFTGRDNDGASNLYYYRARYYSPQLGRFISQDPIRFAGGINSYAYADGDPISEIDPLGLSGYGGTGLVNRPLPPPPNRKCMNQLLVEEEGPIRAKIIEEFSLFSLFPMDENLSSNFLLEDAVTAGGIGAKFGVYRLLSGVAHVAARTTVTAMKVFLDVGATPLMIESTYINLDVADRSRQESGTCGC